MKSKTNLSVVLATYNEEANLTRCLKAVKDWADEMVVVDGSSTDKTREIAKKLGARVYKTSNKPMFHINKQLALDKARGEWILQLDADEIVSRELRQEISKVLTSTINYQPLTINGFFIPRLNYFLGKTLRKGGQYPDYVLRLVKNGKARFPCKSVHEQIEIEGEADYLKNPLKHFTTPTVERYWTNANRYTSFRAEEMQKVGLKITLLSFIDYILIKPFWAFFLRFFRHKGFVDGWRGFVFALFSGLDYPISYFKLWELKKSPNSNNQQPNKFK